MFDLVRRIRAEQTGLPLEAAPALMSDRLKVVEEVVNKLYQSTAALDPKAIPVYQAESLHFGDFAFEEGKGVRVSSLLLLEPNEIPQEFRFTGIDDPRLDNETTLRNYTRWLCDKLGTPKMTPNALGFVEPTALSMDQIKANLLFFQDSDKAKQAIKFLLMHELGHYHNNDLNVRVIFKILAGAFSVSWPIGVAIAICCSLSFTVPVVLAAIPLALLAGAVSWCALNFLATIAWKYQEGRADAFAIEHCPESIDGGIHVFKTMQEEGKMALAKAPNLPNFVLSPEGDQLDLFHPSLSSRIATLEAAKQQLVPLFA